jgi:phage-related minor tail protein
LHLIIIPVVVLVQGEAIIVIVIVVIVVVIIIKIMALPALLALATRGLRTLLAAHAHGVACSTLLDGWHPSWRSGDKRSSGGCCCAFRWVHRLPAGPAIFCAG